MSSTTVGVVVGRAVVDDDDGSLADARPVEELVGLRSTTPSRLAASLNAGMNSATLGGAAPRWASISHDAFLQDQSVATCSALNTTKWFIMNVQKVLATLAMKHRRPEPQTRLHKQPEDRGIHDGHRNQCVGIEFDRSASRSCSVSLAVTPGEDLTQREIQLRGKQERDDVREVEMQLCEPCTNPNWTR